MDICIAGIVADGFGAFAEASKAEVLAADNLRALSKTTFSFWLKPTRRTEVSNPRVPLRASLTSSSVIHAAIWSNGLPRDAPIRGIAIDANFCVEHRQSMAGATFLQSLVSRGESTCTMWWHLSDPAEVSATSNNVPITLHSFLIDSPPMARIACDSGLICNVSLKYFNANPVNQNS